MNPNKRRKFRTLEAGTTFAYKTLVSTLKTPNLADARFCAGVYDALKFSAEETTGQRLEDLPRGLDSDGSPNRYTLQIIFGRTAARHLLKELRDGPTERIKMDWYAIKETPGLYEARDGKRESTEDERAVQAEIVEVAENQVRRRRRAYDHLYGHLHDPNFTFKDMARYARRVTQESSLDCLVDLIEYVRQYF